MGGNGHQPGGCKVRRIFYKGILADTIEISGADAHHLMHVMRAKPGQEVIVVDDENQVARMEMTGFTSDAVTMKLVERLDADTESPIRLVLAVCLLKADKMDFVVQKAVELGVNCIVPVASHNCVVRYDSKKAVQRQQRWQKIADEAAKQCGRTALVKVMPIEPLQQFLCHAWYEDDMDSEFLFCYENEENVSVRDCLQRTTSERYLLLIGPEGGFTLEEAEGVGLAAPQIGKDIRLFIVDCTPWAEEDPSCADYKRAFVNPEIYEFSEEKKTYNEGCLSFPGIHADVARSLSIRMRYMDTDFVEHDEEFTGLKAWVIQHEYDHIEGVVFTDRIAPLRRQLLKSKLLNLAKGKYRCAYKTR